MLHRLRVRVDIDGVIARLKFASKVYPVAIRLEDHRADDICRHFTVHLNVNCFASASLIDDHWIIAAIGVFALHIKADSHLLHLDVDAEYIGQDFVAYAHVLLL